MNNNLVGTYEFYESFVRFTYTSKTNRQMINIQHVSSRLLNIV